MDRRLVLNVDGNGPEARLTISFSSGKLAKIIASYVSPNNLMTPMLYESNSSLSKCFSFLQKLSKLVGTKQHYQIHHLNQVPELW